MNATFYIPLIGTPIYAIKDTGIDVPYTVQFLEGAYKKNGRNWQINNKDWCPSIMKGEKIPEGKPEIKDMDMIFGVPPCRFLSMLNVKHDKMSTGDSQQCMMNIAKEAVKTEPKVFRFQNAPRLSSAKPALQWAIPTLIDIMKPHGYKFAIYKTTTLNHGLPQKRQRTFFIAYKGPHRYFDVYKLRDNPVCIDDLIGDLYDQKNGEDYSVPPQNDLQRWLRQDNNVVSSHKQIQNWFYWKELMQYCVTPNKSLMYQMTYKGQDYGYNWKQMLTKVSNDRDRQKLEKIFKHAEYKMSIGKGYWDSSPMLASGPHVNAVISKNAYRLVHPNKQRILTLRQLSRFMGIPDKFEFHERNPTASLGFITQNVPSFTFADVRQELKKHVNNTGDVVDTDKDLIYIENISDKGIDKYYAYDKDQIINRKFALGRDKNFYIGDYENKATPFLKRVYKTA